MNLHQMIAVVQCYIHTRTDKEVDINMHQFNNPHNVLLLTKAYTIANNWFQENNGTVTKL